MSLVLLVEDDVLLRAAMARALHKLAGVEIVEAATIAEAIELVRSLSIDLVITDLQLGDRTALELLPHARMPGHQIPTILVSGHVGKFKRFLPPELRVLEKPLAPGALREVVAKMLGRKEHVAPFTLADYLQLAAFGRHSLRIDLSLPEGGHLGTVTIVDGEAWSASDGVGSGMPALARLVTLSDVQLACTRPDRAGDRNLTGSCEQALMEAARIVDERRADRRRPKRPTTEAPPLPEPPRVIKIPPREGPTTTKERTSRDGRR